MVGSVARLGDTDRSSMTESPADAHRRIADAGHGVEERVKALARKLPDPENADHAADELSRRADEHIAVAERSDDRAEG
jgi:hypothetical protein